MSSGTSSPTRRLAYANHAPHAIFVLAVSGLACFNAFLLSINVSATSGGVSFAPGLENYSALCRGLYPRAFALSAILASTVAVLALFSSIAAAWPLRFWLSQHYRGLMIGLFALPLISGYYVRTSALKLLIASASNMMPGPAPRGLDDLPHMGVGLVLLGTLLWVVPITTLLAYAALARIPLATLRAARNHGASTVQVLCAIVVPAAETEILVICIFSAGFAFADAYGCQVLSNGGTYLFAGALADQLRIPNWPLFAAGSFLIVLVQSLGAVFLIAALRFLRMAWAR